MAMPMVSVSSRTTRCCPSSLAKLVNITFNGGDSNFTLVYGRYTELLNGGYKPTYNWGAAPCMVTFFFLILYKCTIEEDGLCQVMP